MRRARPTRLVPRERACSQSDARRSHTLRPPYRVPQGCAARSLTLMQLNTLCVKKASRQCFTTDAQR